LGPYEILAPIGAGGMGEVHKARDPRLSRIVAIKTSSAHFSERFEREARAIAALNHPHICQIYDVGPDYLVMEYIEGRPLAGPLPLAKALEYGRQICDALDAAHRKGIAHRDLKPGNILVTKSGIKLLDFGLAKTAETPPTRGSSSDETITKVLTGRNEIVGTLQYMSPEQLQTGVREVDTRTDIFSFGLVLYEMLTGKPTFDGPSPASLIAAIIERPAPPITDVAPAALDRVLKTCLAKDPDERWQCARDLQRELEWFASACGEADSIPARRRIMPWAVAAVSAFIALIGWLRSSHPAPVAANQVAFSILPPSGVELTQVGALTVDRISPDGSMILFRGYRERYHLRKLNSLESEALPDWRAGGDPFWSPDSLSIAFPTYATPGRLMRMRLPKGAQELIYGFDGLARGGSWAEKGSVLLAVIGGGSPGLYSAPAAGGVARHLEVPGFKEGLYYNPEFLPGREDFLFTFVPADSEGAQIYLATLRDGKIFNPQLLLANDTSAAFTPAGGGRILFVRADNLYSQKLDLRARKLSGDPELLQEHVASFAASRNAYFSVSRNGAIAWRSGTAVVSQIVIFDRKGNRTGSAGTAAPIQSIRLSPDGSRLLAYGEGASWIVDANGSGRVSLNHAAFADYLWSPDGSRLLFAGKGKIWEMPAGDPSQTRELADIPGAIPFLRDISSDGRRILYNNGSGLFFIALDGKVAPERVTGASGNAGLSPDGTWVVYAPESGIYSQFLSGTRLPRQIANTGFGPVWRSDGKEILYADRGKIWSVRVEGSGAALRFGTPELLFTAAAPMGLNGGSRPLAVSRDGSRIYFLQSAEQPQSGAIQVRTAAVR
jgi:serine/threonine protein kinase